MKKSFLALLVGQSIDKASLSAMQAGYYVEIIPERSAVSAVARPNTILLSHSNGVITSAAPGDIFELKED